MKTWYVTYIGEFEDHEIKVFSNGESPVDGAFTEHDNFALAKKALISYIKEDIDMLKIRLKKAKRLKKGDYK